MFRLLAQTKIEVENVPEVTLTTDTVGNALSAVFIAIGALSILFLLIGGVRYILSAGDQSQVTQAKNTIMYALVGIVVSLSAFAIVQLVVGALSS